MLRILEKNHRIQNKSFRFHNTGWILMKKSVFGMLIYIHSQAEQQHAGPQRHLRSGGGEGGPGRRLLRGEAAALPEQVHHTNGSSSKEENQIET
jgi:hypothetical protein